MLGRRALDQQRRASGQFAARTPDLVLVQLVPTADLRTGGSAQATSTLPPCAVALEVLPLASLLQIAIPQAARARNSPRTQAQRPPCVGHGPGLSLASPRRLQAAWGQPWRPCAQTALPNRGISNCVRPFRFCRAPAHQKPAAFSGATFSGLVGRTPPPRLWRDVWELSPLLTRGNSAVLAAKVVSRAMLLLLGRPAQ